MSAQELDPRNMTKHEWDMLWCGAQGKKSREEIEALQQATPEEAISSARSLIRKSMTIELDDPIYEAIDYIVIARSALDADIQQPEKEALQSLLARVEAILRFADKNSSKASIMLWAQMK